MLGLWKLRSWLPSKKNMSIFSFFGHRSFGRNKTQTAVINMEIKGMLENKIHFSMFRQSKRQVHELCFPTSVSLSRFSRQFVYYF